MKTTFRCEKCNREFASERECQRHEKDCRPKSLEERVEDLERRLQEAEVHIELLKASEGYRRRTPVFEPICPTNPLIGPWGPATCGPDSGPWGPATVLPRNSVHETRSETHEYICEGCANRDKYPNCKSGISWSLLNGASCAYRKPAENKPEEDCEKHGSRLELCSSCVHLCDECGPMTQRLTKKDGWTCTGYEPKTVERQPMCERCALRGTSECLRKDGGSGTVVEFRRFKPKED